MAEIIIKQATLTDVKVYPVQDCIPVHQDGVTVMLEKSKAVELQNAINLLK